MNLRDGEVDATGSGSCPVASFGVSGVEPSGSATGELLVRWILGKLCGGLKRLTLFLCYGLVWSHLCAWFDSQLPPNSRIVCICSFS
jgi:hypothetical protein